jgi:hypothetical protein
MPYASACDFMEVFHASFSFLKKTLNDQKVGANFMIFHQMKIPNSEKNFE